MDNPEIYSIFTLSERQSEFLRSKKYKLDRMECFMSLMSLAERSSKLVQVSKTKQVEILSGQIMVDFTNLAQLWGLDRKTVPKILKTMDELGISSSQKIGDDHIFTLHALTGWYVNGQYVANSFGCKRSPDGKAIVHAPVPPARVIITEVDETQNKGASNPNGEKGITPVTNVATPSSQGVPASPSSPQSNDSVHVGASGSDGRTSAPPSNNISPQSGSDRNSVGSPLSQSGAVANPNVGGQNQRPPQQPPSQPNGSPRPPFINSPGNPPGSNGFNSPNGSQNPQR